MSAGKFPKLLVVGGLNSLRQWQENAAKIPKVCKALRCLQTNQKDDQEKGGQRSAKQVTLPVVATHHSTIRHFYPFMYLENSLPKGGMATHNATYVCAHPFCTTLFFLLLPFAGKKTPKTSLHFSHMCTHAHVVAAHDTVIGFHLSNLCTVSIY